MGMIFYLVRRYLITKLSLMKKLYIALSFISLFLFGCQQDYDEVINPSVTAITILEINQQDSIDYGLGDSIIYLQIKAAPVNEIGSVSSTIKDPFGNTLISLNLLDNGNIEIADSIAGDSTYSNKFIFNSEYPSGQYSLVYYINNKQAAIQFMMFENGKEKFPPVISNLVMQDSVAFSDTFDFTVLAIDSNGTEDISLVYYELFRPDGSQVVNSQGISKFPMYDNGDGEIGDVTAGDNIYSYRLSFPPNIPSIPPGTWRFEFSAVDRTNRLSNKIIHYLEVH
jgi:hypothetical protein